MNMQIWDNKIISETQKQDVYPVHYVVEISFDNPKARLKLTKGAKKLMEHLDIVKEARNLYAEGKVISWEEFVRNEAK